MLTLSRAGAFSGLIAYGVQINLTRGTTGRDPWRNLFIIEGVLAVFVGILVYVLLPRFPDRIKGGKTWLFSKEEIDLAVQRMTSKFSPLSRLAFANFVAWNTVGSKPNFLQIVKTFIDLKAWGFAVINGAVACGISSVGVFLPSFIVAFGYTAADAQLFSVIPYACAFVTLIVVSSISDRVNMKGPFLIGCLSLTAVGYIMLMTVTTTPAKMAAACLITAGL